MSTRKATPRKATARKPKTLTTAQKVAGAKLPTATQSLCLRGDLITAYQAAEAKLAEALTAVGESLAGTPDDVLPLAQAVDDIRQEMQDYTLDLTFQAMDPEVWKALEDEHPPRRSEDGGVHEQDRRYGVDITTFFPEAIMRSVVSPDDLTPELWEDLFGGKLTDGQIKDMCATVWALNQGRVSIPFSPAVSKILASFGKK